MATLRATLVVLMSTFALAVAEHNYFLSDEFIAQINSNQNTWKAGRNFPPNTPMKHIKKLMGARKDDHFAELPKKEHDADLIASLPDNFDPRDKWPNCPSLNEIRDQGCCGSCWAFGAVEAMTDRYCTYSNGTQHFHFSADDLVSCCYSCGNCEGGGSLGAWNYWKNIGIVSGGNFNSSQGCRPYEIRPTHPTPTKTIPCSINKLDKTPECRHSCNSGYNVDYAKDKRFGKSVYSVSTEDQIKAELFKNGPVEAIFAVYADFLHYKTGVYKHDHVKLVGGHAIKILGYGVEDGTKYWLLANSWSSYWGDHGYVKFLRGEDHCGIESNIVAGEPLFP